MVNASRKAIAFLFENSLFLILGAVSALVLANSRFHHEYEEAAHSVHFLVNDMLMAFFFGRAAKEIREQMLPGGALNDVRTAALPLFATVGGMLGPVLVYVIGAGMWDPLLMNGWAIPTATDIAFAYMATRFIFGGDHPAIPFLLLLAIADDGGGLGILAFCYPTGAMNPLGFGLIIGAVGLALAMYRVLQVQSFWAYLAGPGVVSWFGFWLAGIHPALALVPLMWCMPHEHSDMGPYAEEYQSDTLNQFASWWAKPTELILLAFGFVNAGVAFTSLAFGTGLVATSLIIGKPVGIFVMTMVGLALGLRLPDGMNRRDVLVLGSIAGIGFTVALFVTGVAFPVAGPTQDALKMGALVSFLSAPISIGLAWALGVGRFGTGLAPISEVDANTEADAAK